MSRYLGAPRCSRCDRPVCASTCSIIAVRHIFGQQYRLLLEADPAYGGRIASILQLEVQSQPKE